VASTEEQLRTIKAAGFSATFDRVVWLDAGALAGIFSATHGGNKIALHGCPLNLVHVALWMFGISLLLTLPVPIWRAWLIAQGAVRVAWETYLVQGSAALLTGVAVLLTIAGFVNA
jgi:hypothetical protein